MCCRVHISVPVRITLTIVLYINFIVQLEPDYEHGHTKESYTMEFDAIVDGIRRHADPEHMIKFVGMNNPNIDDTAKVVEWATYFLNATNHAMGAQNTIGPGNYIGFHAYPTSPARLKDEPDASAERSTDLENFFAYVDEFVDRKVPAVRAVINAMAPGTKIMLDECGTIGPIQDALYWTASAGYWAYFWARAAFAHAGAVTVVGQSQFMDSPDREPGVTMMDWNSGNGTQKYWALKIILDASEMGDLFRKTVLSPSSISEDLYAQAWTHGPTLQRKLLLINKRSATVTVSLTGPATALIIDEETGFGPPRKDLCTAGKLVMSSFAVAIVDVQTY